MDYDFVFDSEKKLWGRSHEEVEFDGETKPEVSILFEREGIVLRADQKGNAVFRDLEGSVIHEDRAESGGYFSRVHVRVHEGRAVAEFPVTKWIDHYPHCDGEYDRWSEVILDTIAIPCPNR